MKELQIHERPRERLAVFGASALSDRELMAVLLGTGQKSRDLFEIADEVIQIVDTVPRQELLERVSEVAGVGEAKAGVVAAALELARRRIRPEGTKIRDPRDVVPLLSHLTDRKQEHFCCVTLSGAHEVIALRVVTVGLANMCQVHPREVLADPITDRACAIVVAHNHPSGNLEASNEDLALTKRLIEASKVVGITLLDHLIISRRGYLSLRESSHSCGF